MPDLTAGCRRSRRHSRWVSTQVWAQGCRVQEFTSRTAVHALIGVGPDEDPDRYHVVGLARRRKRANSARRGEPARATTWPDPSRLPLPYVAVQTDATGNIYVGGFQGNFAKAVLLVAKLSPTGQTLYSTTLAGSNFGIAWAIAVDSSGAAYVFGNTNSPSFPVTPGALQTTMRGTSQGFVTKLDPAGKIVYSTFVGGATDVTPGLTSAPGLDSILLDSAGDVIITGKAGTNSMLPPFPRTPAPTDSRTPDSVSALRRKS